MKTLFDHVIIYKNWTDIFSNILDDRSTITDTSNRVRNRIDLILFGKIWNYGVVVKMAIVYNIRAKESESSFRWKVIESILLFLSSVLFYTVAFYTPFPTLTFKYLMQHKL